MIDTDGYLGLRKNYPFGSADDPQTGTKVLPNLKFFEIDLFLRSKGNALTFDDFVIRVAAPSDNRFVVTGDFGIGKSVALRELFLRLSSLFQAGNGYKFPILLNLRDHQGQVFPDEALRRHAKSVGFASEDQLVRAWRANCVYLLLDGFDELVPSGLTQLVKSGSDARRAASELIRRFVTESSYETAIVIAGRDNYFNTEGELQTALQAISFEIVSHNGFSENQAIEFLSYQLGLRRKDVFLPLWLPPKPLLLGWFAANQVLSDLQSQPSEAQNVGTGWDWLLDRIVAREVERSPGVSPDQLRRLVETMALIARRSPEELGSIPPEMMAQAFKDVFGIEPDVQVRNILDRLCGLALSEVPGHRRFVDADFYQAAQAGAVFDYVVRPAGVPKYYDSVLEVVGDTTAAVVSAKCQKSNIVIGRLLNALEVASSFGERAAGLSGDLLKAILESERVSAKKFSTIYITGALFPWLELDPNDWVNLRVVFESCVFRHLVLHDFQGDVAFSFVGTEVELLECSKLTWNDRARAFETGSQILRVEIFSDTNDAVMSSDLPIGYKVLKTILRKLFIQKGAGRQERAFHRGIGNVSQNLVGSLLQIIREAGFAAPTRLRGSIVWHPNRAFSARAKRIIDSMHILGDEVVLKAVEL